MRLIQTSDVSRPEFQEQPRRSLASRLFWKITTFSLLLFTGFCFLKAGAGLFSGDSDLSLTEVEAAVPARITETQLQTTPIQQMRPGCASGGTLCFVSAGWGWSRFLEIGT